MKNFTVAGILGVLFSLMSLQSLSQVDAQISVINKPTAGASCSQLKNNDTVTLTVRNNGSVSIGSFVVGYRINNGTATTSPTIFQTINPGQTYVFKFNAAVNLNLSSASFKAFVTTANDVNRNNDTLAINFSSKINTFPYLENFDNNDGAWRTGGGNTSWAWGVPNKPAVVSAFNSTPTGTKAWFTGGLTNAYNPSETSWLESPCFDFTNVKYPELQFKIIFDMEPNWEVMTMDYSLNGGSSWTRLGTANEPTNCNNQNWYANGSRNAPGWHGMTSPGVTNCSNVFCPTGYNCGRSWTSVKRCISEVAGRDNVKFRFIMATGQGPCQGYGFGVDSFWIGESIKATGDFTTEVKCPGDPVIVKANVPCYKSLLWDFGNGRQRADLTSTFTLYNNPDTGFFTISLIVENFCGSKDTIKKRIYIPALPNLQLSAASTELCPNDNPVTLNSNIQGGHFIYQGDTITEFNPGLYNIGLHRVPYVVVLGGTCTIRDTIDMRITNNIDLSLTNIDSVICVDDAPILLQGNPSGGIFFINNIRTSVFNPQALGVGNHTIRYSYTSSSNCTAQKDFKVEVKQATQPSVSISKDTFCLNDSALVPTVNPTGGILTVNGQTVNNINPSSLGSGNFWLVYTTSENGVCQAKDSVNFEIITTPTITINIDTAYCLGFNIPLVATPLGGVFSVNNQTYTTLNSADLGVGTHKLVYTVTIGNCVYIEEKEFKVFDQPTLAFVGISGELCLSDPAQLLSATPSGGEFFINNQPATAINPQILGAGIFEVKYIYGRGTTCVDSISRLFRVNTAAIATINVADSLCEDANNIPLSASIAGGTFEVDGVATTSITQNLITNKKEITVTYNYTDPANGCLGTVSKKIIITPKPVGNIVQGDSVVICEGESIELSYSDTQTNIIWSNGSTNNSITVNPTITTVYTATPTNTACPATPRLIKVVVLPIPNPAFIETSGKTIAPFDAIFKALDTSLFKYEWFVNETEQNQNSSTLNYPISKSGPYAVTLKVYNELNCGDSFTLLLDIEPSKDFKIPNIFTPNGDEFNETFQVYDFEQGIFQKFYMVIYNRWGNLMYESENENEAWDGSKPNGTEAADGYYYFIIRHTIDNEEKETTGMVKLMR